MKFLSLFAKRIKKNPPVKLEREGILAEELEARTLYSAAPVDVAIDVPVVEATEIVVDREKPSTSQSEFRPIDDLVSDSNAEVSGENEDDSSLEEIDCLVYEIEYDSSSEQVTTMSDRPFVAAESMLIPSDLIPSAIETVRNSQQPQIWSTGTETSPGAISLEDVKSLATEGVRRWIESGLSEEQIEALGEIEYRIDDLGANRLAMVEGNVVTIDFNASENGWFIDSTPDDDEEFSPSEHSGTALLASDESVGDKIDLLTVLMHEQGHVIGLADSGVSESVMHFFRFAGHRNTPGQEEAFSGLPGSIEFSFNSTYHNLASGNFSQDWSSASLSDDDWSGVDSIIGYRGDGLTGGTGTDPQTILGDGSSTPVDLTTSTNAGGVIHLVGDVVGLQGSGTADAPHLVLHLDASGRENIQVAFNLTEEDADNAEQQVAVQYRIGTSGDFINLPAGYVADASDGAALVTPVNVTLPTAANGQSQVQVRIITSNAGGTDSLIGVDDIVVTSDPAASGVDGLGSATVGNASGGVLDGTDVFLRATGSQTVSLELTGVSSGTIETIEIDVPAGWTGLAVGNLVLSGAGLTGASASVAGNTITITGAALTDVNLGNVAISGLTTPDPAALSDDGNYTFSVRTAESGGTPTVIANQPVAYVTIPIVNLSDNDANGIPLDSGVTVAIEGVATPQQSFTAGSLNTFFQDSTDGVGTFLSGGTDVIQGNIYVVKGSVTHFNGATQLSPDSDTDVIDLGASSVPAVTSVTIAALLAGPESFEGQLIRIVNTTINDGTTTWAGDSSVQITDDGGTSLIDIRVDGDTDMDSNPAPTGTFSVTGILSQFDTSDPRDSGYQILPRALSDISTVTTPGLTVSPATLSVNETGTTATFTVVLNAEPATDVVLTINTSDGGEATVSPDNLTFTNGNWDTPQTVTVTGVDDALADGNQTVVVTIAVVDASSDDEYDAVDDATVTVTVVDDETTPTSPLTSIVFNEILADPNGAAGDFDTDGDGTSETADEFLEIYNTSSASIDISGLQFWDSGDGNYLTIPDGTILGPNGFVVVVSNITGGTLPAVASGSHAFDTGGSLSLANGGDNLVLLDPTTNEYIQAIYNGDAVDDPTTYAGFPAGATRVGNVFDFGDDTDGTSLALSPDGDTTSVVTHNTLGDGSTLATPGSSNVGATSGPEIDITGNGISISSGDDTPDLADHTDFGSVGVGGSGIVRTFTVTNSGTATLTLTDPPTVSGSGAAQFAVGNLSSTSLGVGQSATFTVTYSPDTVAAVHAATLSLTNDDADENPYLFDITGETTPPAPEIDITGNGVTISDGDNTPDVADDTDFGLVLTGESSVVRTFTVTNTGQAALTLTGAPTFSGAGAGQFSSGNFSVSVLNSGETATFTITYNPNTVDSNDIATISIVNDDSDENPYTFDVSGQTQVPIIGTVLDETFDDDSGFTKDSSFFTDGDNDFFGIYNLDNVSSEEGHDFDNHPLVAKPDLYGGTGNILTGEDVDAVYLQSQIQVDRPATRVLTWSNLSISGLSSLSLSADVAAAGGAWDIDDFIRFETSIDGGAFQELLSFEFDGSALSGGGTELSYALQNVSHAISGTGSTLDLRLSIKADGAREEFGIDNVRITGLSAPAPLTSSSQANLTIDPASSEETVQGVSSDEPLTMEQLFEVVQAAIERWSQTGLTPEQIAALENIEYRITDLPPTRVGMTEGNVVTIDVNAAERGWFIDDTPLADEEFSQTGVTTFVANRGTEAAADIDLVTVLMHEQGHILGLHDESSFDQEESLMFSFISEGKRRIARDGQAEKVTPGSLREPSYLSALGAGDIAIVGFNFDNPDQLAFVALEDIDSGTEIKFTDNGWLASDSFRGGEGTHTFVAATTIAKGTVTVVDLSGPALSGSGDQILAYQGDESSPTFLYALNSEGNSWQADATSSNTSALPLGLVDGTSAVALAEIDNAIYGGITSGTKAEILAAIGDPSQWNGSDGSTQDLGGISDFTITGGSSEPEFAIDNETPVGGAQVEGDSGDTSYTFKVTRSVNTTQSDTIDFAVAGSGANAADASDFTGGLASGTLEFAVGETTKTITVLVSGDTDVENDEEFTVTLSGASNGGTITTATATGRITNDDVAATAPVLSLEKNVSVDGGSTFVPADAADSSAPDVNSGDTVTYQLVVSHDGTSNADAHDLVIADLLSGVGGIALAGNPNIAVTHSLDGDITGEVAIDTTGGDLSITVPSSVATPGLSEDLIITGVFDGPLTGGIPKGIELYVANDIADLSVYGIGSANNGGGSDGEEFTFPADSVTAGSFIYVASEATEFQNFFGFAPDYTSGVVNVNGDDAIELFLDGSVIDTFGDINTDGSGENWEYLDGWAYRNDQTDAGGATFTVGEWAFSGPNALDGESSNASAVNPVPIGSYTAPTGSVGSTALAQGSTLTITFDAVVTGSDAIYTNTSTVDYDDIAGVGGDAGIQASDDANVEIVTETTPPTVSSITRLSPTDQYTNEDTVTFQVTFSEDVQNVDASDFVTLGTAAGATINSVSQGANASVYEVEITGVDDANGSLGLDFAGSQDISDLASNDLGDTTPTGANESYIIANGSLGDYVWYDIDGDGIQDADEPGFEGIIVDVRDITSNAILSDFQTTTAADGSFSISGLPIDSDGTAYRLRWTAPSGTAFTTLEPSPSETGSNATSSGEMFGTINLTTTMPAHTSFDAGLVGTLSVGGLVWNDVVSDDGAKAGESGVSGVTVNLFTTQDLVNPIKTTTTAPDGSYSFDSLFSSAQLQTAFGTGSPVEYVVQVVPAANQYLTTKAGDSDFDSGTGLSADINLTADEENLDAGFDPADPVVATLSPTDDATGVLVDSDLAVTFNEDIVLGTGNITITGGSGGPVVIDVTNHGGQLSFSGLTLTINPAADLEEGTSYSIQIDATAIDDLAGNSFAGITDSTTWSFTTIDATDPTLAVLSPLDDTADVTIDTDLTVTFDEDIVLGTGNITLTGASGGPIVIDVTDHEGQLSVLGTVLTINPSADLEYDTVYRIQIDPTAVDDLAGNSFAGITDTTTWNFTTESAPEVGGIIITELADPDDNASARFVEIYNSSSSGIDLTDWTLQRWTNGNSSPTTSSNIDLSSIGALGAGEFAVIAANGTVFQSVYGFTATIVGGTGGPADSNGDDQIAVVDNTGSIIDIFGVPGEDGSGTSHEFEDGRAVRKASATEPKSTWDVGDWDVFSDANTAQNASAMNPFSWAGAPDTTAPVARTLEPTDNATDVAIDSNLFVTFSEEIELGAAGSITISDGVSPIVIDVTHHQSQLSIAGNVLTINPTNPLNSGTSYSVTIDSGAILDSAGNVFGGIADPDWTFETANAAPVLGATPAMSLEEGETLTVTVEHLGNPSDSDDSGSELTVTVAPNNGQFEYKSAPGTAITSFTVEEVTNGDVQFVHDGSNSAPTYSVVVIDDQGGNTGAPAAASITFVPGNDAPDAKPDFDSIKETGGTIVGESALISDNVMANDTDADADHDPATATGVTVTGVSSGNVPASGNVGSVVTGAYGKLVIDADGTYSYTLIDELVRSLNEGDVETEVFTYIITDDEGESDTATLTVTVNGTNDHPVANDDSAELQSVPGEVVSESGDVIENDEDVDDAIEVVGVVAGEVTTVAAANVGTKIEGTYGDLTLNTDGTYQYDIVPSRVEGLGNNDSGVDVFTYLIEDGQGAQDYAHLRITVDGSANEVTPYQGIFDQLSGRDSFIGLRINETGVDFFQNPVFESGREATMDLIIVGLATQNDISISLRDSNGIVLGRVSDPSTNWVLEIPDLNIAMYENSYFTLAFEFDSEDDGALRQVIEINFSLSDLSFAWFEEDALYGDILFENGALA